MQREVKTFILYLLREFSGRLQSTFNVEGRDMNYQIAGEIESSFAGGHVYIPDIKFQSRLIDRIVFWTTTSTVIGLDKIITKTCV